MDHLNIKTLFVDEESQIVSVELEGYIDQTNCHELENLFKELKESRNFKLIFNFERLQYLSSAGWGVFIGEVKEIREQGGDIKIVNMNPEVYEIYQMLEFYHILEDYSSMDDAVSAFRSINGGQQTDLKETGKTPEIIDEILNDNHQEIQEEDFTVEEASIDIYEVDEEAEDNLELSEHTDALMDSSHAEESPEKEMDFDVTDEDTSIKFDITRLPIQEKIKHIVAQYPLLSFRQIKQMLSHEEFGKERIGYFRLFRLLRALNLDTKEKRYRYWRSC